MAVVDLYGLHVDANKVSLKLHDYCVPQNTQKNNSNSIEVGNSRKQDRKPIFSSVFLLPAIYGYNVYSLLFYKRILLVPSRLSKKKKEFENAPQPKYNLLINIRRTTKI